MNSKMFPISAAVLMCCSLTVADSYQWQGGVAYTEADFDFGERDTTLFEGSYYFSPVSMSDVPLSEAAFLARAGSVSVGYERFSVTEDPNRLIPGLAAGAPVFQFSTPLTIDPGAITGDVIFAQGTPTSTVRLNALPYAFLPVNTFPVSTFPEPVSSGDEDSRLSLAAEYITDQGWIVGGDYARSSGDAETSGDTFTLNRDREFNRLGLKVGKFFGPTAVTFNFVEQSDENSSELNSSATDIFGMPISTGPSLTGRKGSASSYSLSAKSIVSRWGYYHKLEANAGYAELTVSSFSMSGNPLLQPNSFSNDSYEKQWGVGYAFYPRNTIEVGFSFTSVDQEFGDRQFHDFSVQWFITPRVAFDARYFSSDRSFIDEDGFSLGLVGRY